MKIVVRNGEAASLLAKLVYDDGRLAICVKDFWDGVFFSYFNIDGVEFYCDLTTRKVGVEDILTRRYAT